MKRFIFSIVLFLSVLLVGGCNSQKQAQKQLNKIKIEHPELFRADTSFIVRSELLEFPIAEKSISVENAEIVDTLYIANSDIEVLIVRTGEVFEVTGKTKPDTIRYTDIDTVTQIQQETITEIVEVHTIPFIVKLIILVWILSLIRVGYFAYKNRKDFYPFDIFKK